MTRAVEPERIKTLHDVEPDRKGRYVLYWMQAAQRAEHNPALEFAAQRANQHGVPLVVLTVVVADYPEASARHFAFMFGGLHRTLSALERRGMRTCLRVGDPVEVVAELGGGAVETVFDRGYLRQQVCWYKTLAAELDRRITQVEGEVVVPIDLASTKAEYAARTIRPKINAERDRFIADLEPTPIETTTTPNHTGSDISLDELGDEAAIAKLLTRLKIDGGPQPVDGFTPGTPAARSLLNDLADRVGSYGEDRNRFAGPSSTSRLSPYLHFGQISPVAIARKVTDRAGEAAADFLDELIVRRELAINFVARTADYDSYSSLPDWARESLDEHKSDDREHVYTSSELEDGETHDEVWNAIMEDIRKDGWVHNQLRMYWGKQIVNWTNTADHAYRTLLELNNRWFLDGRDPNSFANVGWCFGLHDQGFKERDVGGKLRPFTTAALKRKDNLAGWLEP